MKHRRSAFLYEKYFGKDTKKQQSQGQTQTQNDSPVPPSHISDATKDTTPTPSPQTPPSPQQKTVPEPTWKTILREKFSSVSKHFTSSNTPMRRRSSSFFSRTTTWKNIGWFAVYGIGVGIILVLGVFLFVAKDLPDPSKINTRYLPESTKIFDRTGQHVLYEVHGEQNRTLISIEEIPDTMRYATIALEDNDFYFHHGIKPSSIIRAGIAVLRDRAATQGGSTITQQLIKNTVLSNEKTITRKVKEAVLAIEVEFKFSKDEILQMYLNEIPYGSNAYGVQAAAETYFNKNARDLTLDEAAMLAALPKAPTYYSPYGSNLEDLEARQELALQRMADLGYVSQQEADQAKEINVFAKLQPNREDIKAPHFIMYVREYLEEKYGPELVEEGGMKVITTLDLGLHEAAEEIVAEKVQANEEHYNAENAALVAIDPQNGQIITMVGSRDFFDTSIDGQVNVAIRERQPGSSFKPYVYLAGFQKGYTPETILFDVETDFENAEGESYVPQNYTGDFNGPTQIKDALGQSLNIPAVKMLYLVGVKDAIMLSKRLGISSLNSTNFYGLALVLGGGEVTLLDHTGAYATLANGGVRSRITPILRIEDRSGKELESFDLVGQEQIVEKKHVDMLSHILSENKYREKAFGANSPLNIPGKNVAAKTGTTNEYRDAWTMGYTSSLAVGVWVGNNDNSPMRPGAAGSVVAGPIWRAFMDKALANYSGNAFAKYNPDTIKTGKDILDGKLADKKDLDVCEIPDSDSYCLASNACPDDEVDERDFVAGHSLLYYVDPSDPDGDVPKDPDDDPQFDNWEDGVRDWYKDEDDDVEFENPPTESCTTEQFSSFLPSVSLKATQKDSVVELRATVDAGYEVEKVVFRKNGALLSEKNDSPYEHNYTILPDDVDETLTFSVQLTDKQNNSTTAESSLEIESTE